MSDEYGDGRPDDRCRPGCGACCDPVILYGSQATHAAVPWDPGSDEWLNQQFIVHTLRQLPAAEGERLTEWAPDLRGRWPTDGPDWLRGGGEEPYHFECPHYERETARCTNHEHRPPMCREYPRDDGRDLTMTLPPTCGYVANRGAVPIPVSVEWRQRRARPPRPLDLDRMVTTLDAHRVGFVVIGSVAARLHTSSDLSDRPVTDLDVCVRAGIGTLEHLRDALADLGARAVYPGTDVALDRPPSGAVRPVYAYQTGPGYLRWQNAFHAYTTEAGYLDVLGDGDAYPRWHRMRDRFEPFEVGGVTVSVEALPDLILSKGAAGRRKDRGDLPELCALLDERGGDFEDLRPITDRVLTFIARQPTAGAFMPPELDRLFRRYQ